MNKLVSKNSVLRFKLGRKIVKAEDGWTLIRGKAVLTPISFYGRKKLTHRYIVNGKQYGSFDGGKTYYGLSEGGRPLSYKANQQLFKAIENGKKNDTASTKNTITPRFLSKYSNMSDVIGGANNIKAWLLKLKNYYAPGTYNPDSIWGDNTQAAYERYLEDLVKLNVKFNVSDMPNSTEDTAGLENAREISNLLTVPMELNDFALLKSANYPTNYETTYSNPYVKELFDKVVLRNPVRYTPYYNSNLSYYTPSRFVTFSKEGSKLVSKNPIERFKKTNFR